MVIREDAAEANPLVGVLACFLGGLSALVGTGAGRTLLRYLIPSEANFADISSQDCLARRSRRSASSCRSISSPSLLRPSSTALRRTGK